MGSLGAWVVFFAVALVYLALQSVNRVLAGIALPFLVATTAKFFVTANNFVFRVCVTKPMQRGTGKTVTGDQLRLADRVIYYVHGYAEACSLVSLLAGEALEPSSTWIISVVQSFVMNLVARSYVFAMLTPYVPSRLRRVLRPGCSTHLRNQHRFTGSYPRFVAVLALLCARLAAFGTEKHPLFNNTCVAVVVAVFVFEVLQDVITYRTANLDFTKRYNWDDLPMLSTNQLCARDKNGVNPTRAGLYFHGVRPHYECVTWAGNVPLSLFGWTLITLILGTGFVVGVCETPMEPGFGQLLDGLVWSTPLKC